eukprot:CAMPEP_0173393706 /NCGR_PEP_ID=MMETSP1356-20130122/22263_1 /TAXON_ID=77927 ORGANISM="Hemiselmis virescens, Strain PCC157" /NCGR_SAMPLE_ID=MMETSP1356 /ASSEMBLY_ACC=CAM_ASM_000847 /LENGTH=494 /DNA_ID=CAMNT_0014351765 /DNA_START=13 /DNA_END=1497 /DNA_ORIENTATION=+
MGADALVSSMAQHWRIVVPCAAAIGAGAYLAYSELAFRAKHKGKKLPPVYTEFGCLPIIGAAIPFLIDPLALARRAEAKCGDCFTIKIFGLRITFLDGPEAQENFCRARDDELSQKEAYAFSVPLFGKGIIYDVDTDKRTEQIKLVTASLHTTALGNYVPNMLAELELYFGKLGDKGQLDIYKSLSELIILTASNCLMGREIRQELHSEVSTLYAILDKGCTPISFFAPNLPIPAHINRDIARKKMVKLFKGVIDRRKAAGVKEKDVLQVFMDAKYKSGDSLPAEEVTGLMIALLFAGQHTSSVTSSWTGLFILQAKERATLLKALKQEQAEAGPIDIESIKNKMPLLTACISEALRMHPPLILLMRKVHGDRAFRDMYIPDQDIVMMSPNLSGRRPEVWKNPDEFDPYRWLAPREEHRGHSHAWVGFGGGRHRCIGEGFAYVQIKAIWAYLLRNFDMEAVGPLPKPNYEALVVGPKPPCTVRYARRKNSTAEC